MSACPRAITKYENHKRLPCGQSDVHTKIRREYMLRRFFVDNFYSTQLNTWYCRSPFRGVPAEWYPNAPRFFRWYQI